MKDTTRFNMHEAMDFIESVRRMTASELIEYLRATDVDPDCRKAVEREVMVRLLEKSLTS